MDDEQRSRDSSWDLAGDPAVLADAARTLRARSAELDPDSPLSAPFVYNSVAKLLEALEHHMTARLPRSPLPHDVVQAAMDIARHVRTYRGTSS
jgi:hypothetical protein